MKDEKKVYSAPRHKKIYVTPQLNSHGWVVQLTGSALPPFMVNGNNHTPSVIEGPAIPGLPASEVLDNLPSKAALPISGDPSSGDVQAAPSGSDGTTPSEVGTTPSGSHGTTPSEVGTTPSGSDGTTPSEVGTTPSGSDGTTPSEVGTTPSGSDRTTPSEVGTTPSSGGDEATPSGKDEGPSKEADRPVR